MKYIACTIGMFLCLLPLLFATGNGSNIIGYGTKSISMGGADVAWINDINAMNINPAGIAFSNGDCLGIHVGLYAPFLHHTDHIGNDLDAELSIFPIPNIGYINHVSPGFTLGIGFFTQGGMGATFEDMTTPFGTRDKFSGFVMNLKLTPTLAINLSEKLAIGITVEFDYAGLDQEIFPDTSAASAGFVGMSTDGMLTDFGIGFRIGLQYKPSDSFSLGIAYLSKSNFELEGKMNLNYSSIPGMGNVTYDALISGLDWPQQIDAGITFKPFSNLLVAVDFTWMNWKSSMWETEMTLTNPSVPGLGDIESVSECHWADQYIIAIGLDYQLNERIALQFGYNYGKNPIPLEDLNPLQGATIEHHFSIGGTLKTSSGTEFQAGFTWVFPYELKYTNPVSPFGPDNTFHLSTYGLNIGVNFAL